MYSGFVLWRTRPNASTRPFIVFPSIFTPVSIIDAYMGFDLRRIEFIKRSNLDESVIESIAFAVLNSITPESKHKKLSQ
jgi:hypothetical protein